MEALINEANTFPVAFEEVSRLQELVHSADVCIFYNSCLGFFFGLRDYCPWLFMKRGGALLSQSWNRGGSVFLHLIVRLLNLLSADFFLSIYARSGQRWSGSCSLPLRLCEVVTLSVVTSFCSFNIRFQSNELFLFVLCQKQ